MTSIKRNNRIDTHPGACNRGKEGDFRVVSASVTGAARHGVGPGFAVISGPVVEQEVGRLIHGGDKQETSRAINDHGGAEAFRVHQARYASFAAKASAGIGVTAVPVGRGM